MSNYAESKKQIDKIRSKNEPMFRMAVSHLVDVGIRHLTEDNILRTASVIAKRNDNNAMITNEYMYDFILMAGELAKIPHIDLLVYIQREVEYDVFDGAMTYKRVIKILKNCLDWFADDCYGFEDTLKKFKLLGLDEDEIASLGYEYLFDMEEK